MKQPQRKGRKFRSGKTKKKKAHKTAKETSNDETSASSSSDISPDYNWLDDLVYEPIVAAPLTGSDHDDVKDEKKAVTVNDVLWTTDPSTQTLSIVSWNVLAESYCNPRSHCHLPKAYQKVVFDRFKRKHILLDLLQNHVIRYRKQQATPITSNGSNDDQSLSVPYVDIVCLQEVDLNEIGDTLRQHGYHGIETPRNNNHQSHQHANTAIQSTETNVNNGTKDVVEGSTVETRRTAKCDSCAIYVHSKGQWEMIEYELVQFDDLATNSHPISPNNKEQTGDDHITTTSSNSHSESVKSNGKVGSASNIQGIQQTFLRRNTAILAKLKNKHTKQRLVVANAHLFWDPSFEYVKLCQAHYLLLRAKSFCEGDPVILCGDWNSRPHGAAHTYLTRGCISAKRVAPWYQRGLGDDSDDEDERTETMIQDDDEEEGNADEDGETSSDKGVKLGVLFDNFTLNDTRTSKNKTPGNVRYLLDFTLNKLCRWLRILGLDTALETDEEERFRTGQGKFVLLDRCRKEGRTLVTTSTRLVARRECPPGTYCVNPTYLDKLEVVLVHMLLTHGVVLEPRTFLGRCVVCNGEIVEVHDDERKRGILREYQAPENLLKDNMEIYECSGCRQGYWWCDRPTSSASRVKGTATHLFQLCLRAGVPIRGSLSMFDHIDVDEERKKGWDFTMAGSDVLKRRLDVIEWMRTEKLKIPFDNLESIYAAKDEDGQIVGEILPFTNVTHGFVDTLDYIFVSGLVPIERLRLPKSFRRLSPSGVKNGHLLPSDKWVSDHLAIGGLLALKSVPEETPSESSQENSTKDDELLCLPAAVAQIQLLPLNPTSHVPTCVCGCVPRTPGLFEMAERRKRAKEKAAREGGQ